MSEPERRVLLAIIILAVIMSFVIAGKGIWSFAERPFP